MKVTQKIFSFLVLAAAVLTGCERDYDAPPLNEPVYEGPSANITIADLKENCTFYFQTCAGITSR